MAVDLDSVLLQLESGEVDSGSKLNLRNEDLQQRNKVKTIKKLKRELKKKSRLLFFLEIALPFNPKNGQEDEIHNPSKKWRPPFSATTVALLLKKYANEVEETKEQLLRRANIKEWDTSDLTTLNENDKKVFRLYHVPRIMSVPVININNPTITGSNYAKDYMLKVDRNEVTDQIDAPIDQWPVPLQANKFLREIVYEESAHIDECIQKAVNGEPYELDTDVALFANANLKDMKDDDKKDARRKLFQKVTISEDMPANFVIMYEFELLANAGIKDAQVYDTLTAVELDKNLRYTRMSKEITESFENYKNGTYAKRDRYYDFWEFDMFCPNEVKDEGNDMLVAQGTRYNGPENPFYEEKFGEELKGTLREAIDGLTNIESRFMASARISPYTDDIGKRIIDVLQRANLLEAKYCTDKVVESNRDFINLVYEEDGAARLTMIGMGMSDAKEGTLDPNAVEAQRKEIKLDAILQGDSAEDSDADEEAAVDAIGGSGEAKSVTDETVAPKDASADVPAIELDIAAQ